MEGCYRVEWQTCYVNNYLNNHRCQGLCDCLQEVWVVTAGVRPNVLSHGIGHVVQEACGGLQWQKYDDGGPVEDVMDRGSSKGSPEHIAVYGLCKGHKKIGDSGAYVCSHDYGDGWPHMQYCITKQHQNISAKYQNDPREKERERKKESLMKSV